METETFVRVAFFVFVALAAIFAIETFYSSVVRPILRKRDVNRRLALGKSMSGEKIMLAMKHERGIGSAGSEVGNWLSRTLVQSGLRVRPQQFLLFIAAATFGIFVLLSFFLTINLALNLLLAVVFGAVLPLLIVRRIRSRRMNIFSSQLPDALDIIVRSLRSGHPVSVAMSLVGRELADPIGSEFGLVVDEMTYGLDLPHAIRNLGDRVGLDDLTLLITAVSLQSQSGGNLGEVLSNLSKVLRERFQLSRKVSPFFLSPSRGQSTRKTRDIIWMWPTSPCLSRYCWDWPCGRC
jgi:tight adherence protein B